VSFRERDLLGFIRREAGAAGDEVLVGMGDDAAVIAATEGPLVIAQDQTIEGVHFARAEVPWSAVGRKALARNLSDLAAMGARPWLAQLSLAVPDDVGEAEAREVVRGFLELARGHETVLLGGDLSRSPAGLYLDVSVVGRLHGRSAWTRGGARVGDALWVSGVLGGSREAHHHAFEPRWREAWALRDEVSVHAAIDLSDGLGRDLPRLLAASGTGADVELAALPRRITSKGPVSVTAALADGEDFELLLALPSGSDAALAEVATRYGTPFTRIGVVTAGECRARTEDGAWSAWVETGHEHAFGD
jgi:thiamine-monophosphate kinase